MELNFFEPVFNQRAILPEGQAEPLALKLCLLVSQSDRQLNTLTLKHLDRARWVTPVG